MNKLDMESKDIIDSNIEKIKELFPSVVSENGIDFDLLKQELSSVIIDEKKEKYQLTWPGKKEAILNSNSPISKTLRPVKDKSVNFDNTQNIYIEGDNLEVLKILQESYLNKVKVIYIDPPYNTGSDFIYRDNFTTTEMSESLDDGSIDNLGNKLVTNYSSNGRFHSEWLSMIYSRLRLSKNLLTDDGVIFISIDDNEVYNLKKICDEIFGEYNFICNFIRKTSFGEKTAKPNINKHHDYVLCYAKKIDIIQKNDTLNGEEKSFENYSNPDNDPNGPWTKDSYLIKIDNGRYGFARYPITNPYLNITHYPPVYYDENNRKQWHYVEETFKEMEKRGQVVYYKDKSEYSGEYSFFIKKYQKDIDKQNNNISTLVFDDNEFVNANGTKDIVYTFDDKEFNNSYPKPVKLIQKLIQYSNWNNEEAIILDFFSGSGTTGEAVLRENATKAKKLKYILVQVPEDCGEQSKYKTICDLGEERLRRAAKKIKDETGAEIDYGFRVFRVDDSNMKDEFYMTPDKVSQEQIKLFEDNIKEDRTPDDLITQVLLNLGLKLDLPIEEKNICGNKVFDVDDGELLACFDNDVSIDIIEEIAKINPRQVVFRDSSFATDQDKVNFEERLKRLSAGTKFNVL